MFFGLATWMSLSVSDLHALKGDTTVACSVFGPGEVRQARELIDRYILLMCRFPTLSLIYTLENMYI